MVVVKGCKRVYLRRNAVVYRKENKKKKRVSSRQKGVTDFGRPDAQRMTLPLVHMIEAADMV
jgi:hypothetical protein